MNPYIKKLAEYLDEGASPERLLGFIEGCKWWQENMALSCISPSSEALKLIKQRREKDTK